MFESSKSQTASPQTPIAQQQSSEQSYSQQYYSPYQLQPQVQKPLSAEFPPPKKNPLFFIALFVLAIAILVPLSILLFRGGHSEFEHTVEQELHLNSQDAKTVSEIIRKKSEQYSTVADPQKVKELVVADTLDFDEKLARQTTLDPQVVKEQTKPASPIVFFPPLGPGIPQEGVRIVSGQEASFVLDYSEFSDESGQINLSQDVILYGPDGNIIPEGSFKNFFKLEYNASTAAFVPIVNKVNIPSRYPEGTYVFEIIVRTAQGDEKVIRSAFDVVHELAITSINIPEQVNVGEDLEVQFKVNGVKPKYEQSQYHYRLREDLIILQGENTVYEKTGIVTLDESYDEEKDGFVFTNNISTQGTKPGEYTLKILVTNEFTQEVTSYETTFTLN
ncbi:hypothetical protein D6774_02425 [Candidatus Woesearchaeota archaeon]|nr:MAG: hypothetical protein D6774_02425 [Candidatus Woesearchaeota archaeon]